MNNTAANMARVYQETTLPLQQHLHHDAGADEGISFKAKKPRRDKSDLGEYFIAPDGGWAWLVCIAAGLSNLSIYPCLQQFGFMFRERMAVLGLSSSEITTIINTNPAISACTGLLNGPMFRRFTFRQVALAGSFFIFTGITMTAFSNTFLTYMISYSLLFGFGMGISVSASSLAINTYFKNKRRRAAGFSWTITGLGPIVLPYFVTYLLSVYGVQGTVLIFASLSLHSVVSALIYQPVHKHAPQPQNSLQCSAADAGELTQPSYRCKYCELQQKKELGIFSSQYLYQDDDAENPGFEIIEPGTPMLSRANDGWFGSKVSLASNKNSVRSRKLSSSKDLELTAKLRKVIPEEELQHPEFLKPNNFKRERDEAQRLQFGRKDSVQQMRCTCAEERVLLERTQFSPVALPNGKDHKNPQQQQTNILDNKNMALLNDEEAISSTSSVTFLQKVVAFFDLELLCDFTYVNLVTGLTIINFGELNFSILTPFILNDFGFDTAQITLAMSVLAGLDITLRFLVPFVTEKISWDNRVFFLIGVVGIALGRTVVACTRSFPVILGSFAWIGMCKGVRTIFWPLIIPGCVPLKRLPAASGLGLLISGLFTLFFGPFVGLVRDRWNYSVTLHCLNIMSFVAAISWSLEALVRQYLHRSRSPVDAAT